jgi:pimeloyl-ACP methyl ester carboxylesterase
MKKSYLLLALFILFTSTSFSQKKSVKKMNTIVLVHGAWIDASCWDNVIPVLKAAGHEVLIVHLPGHGSDNTPYNQISLQSYVDAVTSVIGKRTDVTLVGHSLAGIIISEVAEKIPDQIRNLVYISAFLLPNGETVLHAGNSDSESLLGKYLRPDEKTGSASIAKEGIQEVFAADAPKEIVDRLVSQHKADALAPFATPVQVTDARFGRVPKAYVEDTNDRLITLAAQQAMVKGNGNVRTIYSLPSSHTPFFSMPEILGSIIVQEAN